MVPEILTKIAHHKETNYNLRYSTALQGRNIKMSCMTQKLHLVWNQKYGTLY